MISSSPAPPASTTPASFRTASCSGRASERLLPALDDERQEIEPLEVASLLRLGRLGHLANDGEHRALDRPPDGPVRSVARRAEGARDHRLVDRVALAEHVGEAANDLAEDDTRVAARTHQGRA